MRLLLTLLLCFCAVSSQCQAQESERPWWNPFASGESSDEVRSSSFFDGEMETDEPSFKMPTISLPSFGLLRSSEANAGPNAFQRMGLATKKAWGSAVDMMNPFDKPASNKPLMANQGYRPQDMNTEPKKGLFSWFGSGPRQSDVSDVNGFLRQPRPRLPGKNMSGN